MVEENQEFEPSLARMESARDKKGRAFVCTIPNVDTDPGANNLKRLYDGDGHWKYLLVGPVEIAPTTGMKHQHGVVQFDVDVRISTLINKYPGIWFELRRARKFQKAVDYCTKEGPAFFEKGNPPEQEQHLKGVYYHAALIREWADENLVWTELIERGRVDHDLDMVEAARDLIDYIQRLTFDFDEFMDTLLCDGCSSDSN